MENIIGRKIRGFKYGNEYPNFSFSEEMEKYISKIGFITKFNSESIFVDFKDNTGNWRYPINQIKEHLVDEVPTLQEVLNAPEHYNNEYGSLCLFSERQGLNTWEFEVIKRIVRCRKKGEWESDIKKTIDSLNLYKEEQGHLYKGQIEPKNK